MMNSWCGAIETGATETALSFGEACASAETDKQDCGSPNYRAYDQEVSAVPFCLDACFNQLSGCFVARVCGVLKGDRG